MIVRWLVVEGVKICELRFFASIFFRGQLGLSKCPWADKKSKFVLRSKHFFGLCVLRNFETSKKKSC